MSNIVNFEFQFAEVASQIDETIFTKVWIRLPSMNIDRN